MASRVIILCLIPVLVSIAMWVVRYFYLQREFLRCGIWEDIWVVVGVMNLTCIAEAENMRKIGVGDWMLHCANLPPEMHHYLVLIILLMFINLFVFLFCLKMYRTVEVAASTKPPGTATSIGHVATATLKGAFVHALTFASFFTEVDILVR